MTRTVSSSSPSSFRPIEDAATSSIGAMRTGPCQDIWYNNTIMQARITNIVADEMAVAAVMRGVLDAATNQEDNDASLVTTTPEELQEKVRVVSPDPSKKAITKETTNVVSIGGEKNKKPQRRNTQKKAVVPRKKTKPAAPLKKTKKTPKRGQVSKNKASMEDEKKLSPRHFLPGDKTYVDAPTAFDILAGRGGATNHHEGNKRYWKHHILPNRENFRSLQPHQAIKKKKLARQIKKMIEADKGNPRFLEKEEFTGKWFVMHPRAIIKKVQQALRDYYIVKSEWAWARDHLPGEFALFAERWETKHGKPPILKPNLALASHEMWDPPLVHPLPWRLVGAHSTTQHDPCSKRAFQYVTQHRGVWKRPKSTKELATSIAVPYATTGNEERLGCSYSCLDQSEDGLLLVKDKDHDDVYHRRLERTLDFDGCSEETCSQPAFLPQVLGRQQVPSNMKNSSEELTTTSVAAPRVTTGDEALLDFLDEKIIDVPSSLDELFHGILLMDDDFRRRLRSPSSFFDCEDCDPKEERNTDIFSSELLPPAVEVSPSTTRPMHSSMSYQDHQEQLNPDDGETDDEEEGVHGINMNLLLPTSFRQRRPSKMQDDLDPVSPLF